jgi:hypothetical protein
MTDAKRMTLSDLEELRVAVENYRQTTREIDRLESQSYVATVFDGNLKTTRIDGDSRIILFGKTYPELQEMSDAIKAVLLRQLSARKEAALEILKKHNFNLDDIEGTR